MVCKVFAIHVVLLRYSTNSSRDAINCSACSFVSFIVCCKLLVETLLAKMVLITWSLPIILKLEYYILHLKV